MTDLPARVDVAIVGGGPAGLAAAAELMARGVASVLVLERDAEPGGVPRFCGHSPYGLREFRRLMRGPAYARALAERARAAGVVIRTGVMATAFQPGPRLVVSSDAGEAEIEARAVLIATGIRETSRAGRLIGGTKPGGVLGTGALQGLVYGAGMRPFRRPAILGTELVAFSALLTCRHAGIRPVAMIEPGYRITARRPSGLLPRLLGVPLRLATQVIAVEGRDSVEALRLATPEGEQTLATDGLVVTGRFRPEAALLRIGGLAVDPGTGGPTVDEAGRCSVPGYYAAGNVLRAVETAGWCWSEGRAVARAIARDLARAPTADTAALALRGDALKYVLPQRIGGADAPALDRLQLRVSRPVCGRLSLRVAGREVAGRRLDALPERRIFLPLPPPGRDAEVVLEETA